MLSCGKFERLKRSVSVKKTQKQILFTFLSYKYEENSTSLPSSTAFPVFRLIDKKLISPMSKFQQQQNQHIKILCYVLSTSMPLFLFSLFNVSFFSPSKTLLYDIG